MTNGAAKRARCWRKGDNKHDIEQAVFSLEDA